MSLPHSTRPWLMTFALVLTASCGAKPEAPAAAEVTQAAPLAKVEAPASPPAPGTCDACRARYCTNYQRSGVDLVAGCAGKPDPALAPHVDAQFGKDCQAVLDCALKHKCAYDAVRGPSQCYCGSASLETCEAEGPAADASCAAEWKAATRGATNAEILTRFSELTYPSGFAFSLLECDRIYCGPTSQHGQCTPN